MDEDSFLTIDDVNEANKDRLLKMRKILFASVVNSLQRKGLHQVSLAVFNEFEKLTRHITESEITKN